MLMTRVVDESVLTPVTDERPAGEDLRGARLWVDLRAARPKPTDAAADNDWEPANPVKTDWLTYKELVEQALCTRSKDLELGLYLTEACARVHGFAGVRDGLWVLRGLIEEFEGRGLFPEPDGGDLEVQYGTLEWLNDKLPDVLREIPLTMRSEPSVNYSLNYRHESLRQNGMITAAQFEAAAAAGSIEQYESLQTLILASRAELDLLEQTAVKHFGPGILSFTHCRQTLDECHAAVQSILRKRQSATMGKSTTQTLTAVRPASTISLGQTATEALDAWSESERQARAGDVDGALSAMASLAAAEPNGRVRFQRKLLLADICLQSNRKRLGKSILEELHQIVEMHRLDSWETSEIVGAVWTRLVRCYRDREAGIADADKEAEFYLKLSRLDPWQALACGEPAVKE